MKQDMNTNIKWIKKIKNSVVYSSFPKKIQKSIELYFSEKKTHNLSDSIFFYLSYTQNLQITFTRIDRFIKTHVYSTYLFISLYEESTCSGCCFIYMFYSEYSDEGAKLNDRQSPTLFFYLKIVHSRTCSTHNISIGKLLIFLL